MNTENPSGRHRLGRVCSVCGKRVSPTGKQSTMGFATALRRFGISGDKAHPECVAAMRTNGTWRMPTK
jgi:hypothetical protein